jgi:hypothetical protein
MIERVIEAAAKGMIGVAIILGGLAGLALLGVASFGPAFSDWASQRATPGAWVTLALGIWPVLGLIDLLFEGLWEWVHERISLGRRSNGRQA